MSDLRKQVRDHYDEQSLPADKLASILAQGRDAAAGKEKTVAFPARKSRARFVAAAAAVVAMVAGGTWWMNRDVGEVSYAALPPRVIELFDNKPDLLPPVQDKVALHQWLVSKGAPADFVIPPSLLPLESAACQVVDVKGRNAYLSCYWRETTPNRGPHELIHLLVARTEDFYDQPKSADPAIRELDGWSFASWTKGDSIYTLATAAPREKLTPFLSAVEAEGGKRRHLSGVMPGEDRGATAAVLAVLRP
jgi:hypothetical protein